MNEPADIFGDDGTHEFAGMSAEDIRRRSRLLENEIRVLQDETPEPDAMTEQIKENREKIKLSKQLPSLVGNVVEILDVNPEDEAEEDGANVDLDSRGKGKGAGLVGDPDRLKPGDLVGVNKDSYLVLDTLPSEYDSRVKAMEVDEKPTEVSSDIGGPDKQIQNSMEAIVIPVTHKERFDNVSIPPRGVLSYSPTMEYVSALAHLTTFGILGVCIRYGLEILFSNIANVTSNDSSLFIDLPANMVGCFFMGWVGVVLKKDIAAFSGLLVIGLSTGLMGSITTYASWNQELLVLVTHGLWVRSIVGLIIGMELAQMSLSVGMDSAKLLRAGIMYIRRDRVRRGLHKKWGFSSPDNLRRQQISLLIFMATSAILWVASVVLTIIDVDSAVRRRLWLSCVVGPPGVWARWLLARLNGQGIGTNQYLKWLPVGTLLTNVVASTLQSVLATVLLAAPDDSSLLCGALQTGLLGCMSTVSTFVTEVYSLHQSPKRWRAYAYFCISFFCSYSMGALVYTLPVLVDHLSL